MFSGCPFCNLPSPHFHVVPPSLYAAAVTSLDALEESLRSYRPPFGTGRLAVVPAEVPDRGLNGNLLADFAAAVAGTGPAAARKTCPQCHPKYQDYLNADEALCWRCGRRDLADA